MNSKSKLLLSLCLIFQTYLQAQSGLFVDTTFTVEQMVMDFFDTPDVTISNVTYNGGEGGVAYFEGANTDIGLPAGIFLSTGNVFSAIGSNTNAATSDQNSPSLSDPDLAAIRAGPIFDAAILEFDISSLIDTLSFKYIFSSEEYPEYVCSPFNDIFGFFVSGAGYNGPFTDNAENIALVPGSSDYVAINQINSGIAGAFGNISNCTSPNGSLSNAQYYIDNDQGVHLEADGFTVPLPAPFVLLPGELYHVKLVIGDASDGILNSGVYIGIESLDGDSLLVPPAEMQADVQGNTVSFENNSRYATSYLWNFGDGTTSTDRYPAPHTYTLDGNYEVVLMTQNYCCSDTTVVNVEVGDITSTSEVIKPYYSIKNPVRDNIELSLINFSNAQIALYNATGQLLFSQKVDNHSFIDIQTLKSGIYFLQIRLGDQIFVERISVFI